MRKYAVFAFSLLPLIAAEPGNRYRRNPQQISVRFVTGQPAEDQMYELTNGVLDWRDMVMVPAMPSVLNGFFLTNQTMMVGWHPIEATITTPQNQGIITTPTTAPGVAAGMLYTYGNVLVEFSEPLAAVALPIQ